jgi:hypothetical protein
MPTRLGGNNSSILVPFGSNGDLSIAGGPLSPWWAMTTLLTPDLGLLTFFKREGMVKKQMCYIPVDADKLP